MSENPMPRLPKWLISVVVGAIVVALILLYSLPKRIPKPPSVIVVSACRDIAPGLRRVGSKNLGQSLLGVQFDVPEGSFTFRSEPQDMPPGMIYAITAKGGNANMEISNGVALTFEKEINSAFPVLSRYVEERDIRSSSGNVIGKDRWGYLKSGEVWRYVRFFAGDAAGYRPVAPKEASLLDQVISSACLPSAPGS